MKYINIYLLLISITFTSCVSVFNGFPTNSTQLNQANFHYVQQNVSGFSTAIYILGIGGNTHNSMIAEAKSDLLSAYPLGKNQALANVTVDFKFQSILGVLYSMKVCTYTADIVEFDNPTDVSSVPLKVNTATSTLASPATLKDTVSIPENWTFLFENRETKEKYGTHNDFTQDAKYQKVTYVSANTLVNSFYADKGYFLPYIDELMYIYKNIGKYNFIPRKTFWSSELQDGKVKCFNMAFGQMVLLDKNETAYVLPMKMIK